MLDLGAAIEIGYGLDKFVRLGDQGSRLTQLSRFRFEHLGLSMG
jgi:hypothetical protein